MSKRTLFLIFALFLTAFALLVLALYQPQAPKTTITPVPKESVAQTILSFGSPFIATSSSAITLNYSLPVNINTFKNKVTAVQLELQYDPAILTNVKVASGSFFPNPEVLLSQIDTNTGRISYAFDAGLTGKGIAGNGVVANLTFSVKANILQKTAIIFLPKTLVAAEGISGSVLGKTTNGLLTIGEKPSTQSATVK